jgi:hypothetical protein
MSAGAGPRARGGNGDGGAAARTGQENGRFFMILLEYVKRMD